MEATMSGGRLHRSASICKKDSVVLPRPADICVRVQDHGERPTHYTSSGAMAIYGWVGTVPTERNKRPKNCGFGETYLLR